MGTISIHTPQDFSNIIAISDVHGMYEPLVRLLRAGGVIDSDLNWAAQNALIVVIGDSINKGPNSVGVLDLWIKLSVQSADCGGRLIHLFGNHEAQFLADPLCSKKAAEFRAELAQKGIAVEAVIGSDTARGRFLRSQRLAARIGAYLFVHSGLFPPMTWEHFSEEAKQALESGNYTSPLLTNADSVLEARDWWNFAEKRNELSRTLEQNGFFGTVFGHKPSAFGIRGRSAAFEGGRFIKIDNGMAPDAGSFSGSLLVFSYPEDLTKMAFPRIEIIESDGGRRPLTPLS